MPEGISNLDPLAAYLGGTELPNPDLFDPAVLEGAADYLTIFRHPAARMTKRYYRDEKGEVQKEDYGRGKYFSVRVVPITSLEHAVAVIEGLGPNECLVNGRLIAGTDMQRCRRLSLDHSGAEDDGQPTLEEASHHLWVFDFDGLDADDTDIGGGPFDSLADPERTVRYLKSRLPAYFAPATCWWQFSSSAGMMDGSKIRIKLLFWSDRSFTLSEMKHFMRAYPVDPAVWQPAQPVYLSPPVFDDSIPDPLNGRRAGWSRGRGAAVVPALVDYEDTRKQPVAPVEDFEFDRPRSIAAAWGHIDKLLRDSAVPVIHERDGHVFKFMAKMHGLGVGPERAHALYDEFLQISGGAAPDGWPSDPKTWDKIHRIWERGGSDNPPGSELLPLALAVTPGETAKGQRKRFNLLGMHELYHQVDPPWLIQGLIPEGDTLLIGPPKAGKTLGALEVACAVLLGRPAFGRFPAVRHGPVIYLSGEGHLGFPRRLRAWARHYGIDESEMLAAGFWYNRGVPLAANATDDALALIEEAQSKMGGAAALVVIDTMARSMSGLDENSAKDAGLYLAMTEAIREGLNCSTLTLAHTAKADTAVTTSRGSSVIPAGMDAIIGVQLNKRNKTVKLKAEDMKDHTPFKPLLLRQKPIAFEGSGEEGMVLEFSKVLPDEEEEDEKREVTVDAYHGLKRMIHAVLQDRHAFDEGSTLSVRELAEGIADAGWIAGTSTAAQREVEILKLKDRLREGRKTRRGVIGPLAAYCREIAIAKDRDVPRGAAVQPGMSKLEWRWFLPEGIAGA